MSATSAEPLRTAVVGVGHLGRHHARILSTMAGVTFVAAVDLLPERARDAAAASGADALTDYRQLYGRADAVVIAVLTIDHLAVAGEFLDRGVHVLVDNPI